MLKYLGLWKVRLMGISKDKLRIIPFSPDLQRQDGYVEYRVVIKVDVDDKNNQRMYYSPSEEKTLITKKENNDSLTVRHQGKETKQWHFTRSKKLADCLENIKVELLKSDGEITKTSYTIENIIKLERLLNSDKIYNYLIKKELS